MGWKFFTFLLANIEKVILVVALVLIVSGLRASIHPKMVLVMPAVRSVQTTDAVNLMPPPLEFATSKSSRIYGVVRVTIGAGLVIFTLWSRARSRTGGSIVAPKRSC